MNLQEFIDYRKICPICTGNLLTGFHSSRKQVIKYEDNRVTFTFDLKAIKPWQKSYRASYSFGLLDNSFLVEFYTKEGELYYKETPQFLRDRFMELHKNLDKMKFKFYRECVNPRCAKYGYTTKYFKFNLNKASFEDLGIWSENVVLTYSLPEQEDYRIYRMHNILTDRKTTLNIWKYYSDEVSIFSNIPGEGATTLELPLIPFISKDETMKRLNNLIPFT